MPTDGSGNARVERRLAAILAADIAGYSALMGADEESTVRALKGHQSVVLPMIGGHGGRVIDTAGDGILAEFASVLNAVKCAIAIQKTMAERNAGIDLARRMQFRIAVNQGDVVYDETRIYGDGINIAARLEGIAEPGGVLISGKVYDEVRGKLDIQFDDLGTQVLKNIADPVRAYRARPKAVYDLVMASQYLPLPDKPSIAVLPFTNMSGDPDQEFFGGGIAEDILTELSKLRWLFVIARNSSFTYKGKAIDVRLVSRELGVRYVLEGSVRKAGARVRVAGQLIDATTGAHIWAERFDRDLADIFAVQDEITSAVSRAIGPAIVDAERQRAVRKPPETLGAWEAYQRGLWHLSRNDPTENELARTFFQRSAELDAGFGPAYCGQAITYMMGGVIFQATSIAEGVRLGEPFARKAVALDENDGTARTQVGFACFLKGDLHGALREAEQALSLNPNSADGYGLKAASLIFAGQREAGREVMSTALRLAPRDPRATRLMHFAMSQYFDGDYEGAVVTARNVVREFPGYPPVYRWLAASLGQLDRPEAKEALRTALTIAPSSVDMFIKQRPAFMRPADHEHMLEGLRKAGLPE